jgi:hypothetical protein
MHPLYDKVIARILVGGYLLEQEQERGASGADNTDNNNSVNNDNKTKEVRLPLHVAVTAGRKSTWTALYKRRLQQAIRAVLAEKWNDNNKNNKGPEAEAEEAEILKKVFSRLHLLPRVSSERFQHLVSLADAALHPFPFDGSKTAADMLQAGVPYVTLPAEYLRGR